ncbi:MAG TPA: hypothetical protein VIH90_05020 [Candidatus Saccharimonadales bacterium]
MSGELDMMRELYGVEKKERWALFSEFVGQADSYHQRIGDGEPGHYHDFFGQETLVLERKIPGIASPYVFLSAFQETQTDERSVERSIRSIAVDRSHKAIRWLFSTQKIILGEGPYSGTTITSQDEGPHTFSPISKIRHTRHSINMRRAYLIPERHWHPLEGGDERAEVRHVLGEAIGIISSLGYGEAITAAIPENLDEISIDY